MWMIAMGVLTLAAILGVGFLVSEIMEDLGDE